ncbi:MAG: RES domain-containing protein [Pseudomonas sp.]|nr:RES domain-containing protein [Pseudomonas sp.]MDZ4349031.1 RES domain-containing protein [Xanthomonadaceae bacterium]
MPCGKPWFANKPEFATLTRDGEFWHVYPALLDDGRAVMPRQPNPKSTARLALKSGAHAMYYFADTLAGALWEAVLRNVEPDEHGQVEISFEDLQHLRAVKIKVVADGIPLLDLTQPTMRRFGLLPDGKPWAVVQGWLQTPDHSATHEAAAALLANLKAVGCTEMPVLSWPSRQHSASRAFLAYAPPMSDHWWQEVEAPIRLDDPIHGHPKLRDELTACGFSWPVPLTGTGDIRGPEMDP